MSRKNRANQFRLAATLAFLTTPLITAAAFAGEQFRGVSAEIVVPASAMKCYLAIRHMRTNVKVIYDHPDEAMLEEDFKNLPIIGHAKCKYREVYTPGKRVEYTMVESDKFKAFEGRWILTPIDENHTRVELSSYIDTGLVIPFVKKITNGQTLQDVKERLQEIKNVAESQYVGSAKTTTTSDSM